VVPEWQEVADGLQASNQCCYTRDSPPEDPSLGGAEEHAPLLEVRADGRAVVTLGAQHPMTADHWITTMYVRDQDGVVVGFRDFGATQLKPQFSRGYQPSLEIALPAGTTSVRAFSFCNLHSHWAGETISV